MPKTQTMMTPIRDLTLIKPDGEDEFHGKIYIPSAVRANVKTRTGIVVSVGPEPPVEEGDRVMYAGSEAQAIKLDDVEYDLASPELIAGVMT